MSEHKSEFLQRLVVGSRRDGRRRYDRQAKSELVQACLQPGVSVARIAYDHALNANLLRKWISQYQQQQSQSRVSGQHAGPAPTPPFIPVVQALAAPPSAHLTLRARLPNGIEIDLVDAGDDDVLSLLQLLCQLPGSASTPR
jgi:transposase